MDGKYLLGLEVDWNALSQGTYLRSIQAISNLKRLDFRQNVTFLVGENGTGKSTLLEAIAVAWGFNPEGGTINYRFETYNDVSELSNGVRLLRGYRRPRSSYFFRAESFFNLATKAEEYDAMNPRGHSFGNRGLHQQSHGESFLAFFQSFEEEGLYLMDEPEAALSPQRQLSLLIQIHRMAQAGAQFLIATHSPILLGLPGAEILSFDDGRIHLCAYEETESYQVTKLFLNNREQLLRRMLEEP